MDKRRQRIMMPNHLWDNQSVHIDTFPSRQVTELGSLRHISITSPARNSLKELNFHKQTPIHDLPRFTEQSLIRKHAQQLKQRPVHEPIIKEMQKSLGDFKSRGLRSKYEKVNMKLELKSKIVKHKVLKLRKNFMQKMKRNNIHSIPYQHKFKNHDQNDRINGIDIKESLSKIMNTLFVINILITVFIETLSIVFSQLNQNQEFIVLQVIGIIIYLLQILLNLVTIRFSLGRKLETLRQISKQYISQSFSIDVINILIIIINFATSSTNVVLVACKIFILFKVPDWLERIKKLEIQFIENYYKQQYWSLIKVFVSNFLYAHILSIVLLSMANVNQNSNWLLNKGIMYSPWYQKYIWSYYWSTTIMLTIGFGDIIPTCYQEACFMIFIQTISCIILAYNINCVGTLITNIRFQDQEKHKNLKIFRKLAEQNKVSEDLSSRINNFIEQDSNIKKLTNIDEQAKFVDNLPNNYKVEYLKQSNKNIFKKTYFFNYLMERTLCSLAEKIQAKIAHPLEVLSDQKNFDLLILKKGQIACKSSKKGMNKLKKQLINQVIVESQDHPFLLHTNFITKERSNYKIISTVYSLIYYMDFEKMIEVLRNFATDFELYCQLRDKCKYIVDQFQVFKCNNCTTHHTEFQCPKYHFIPFKQHVLHHEISEQKTLKNKRVPFIRDKNRNLMKYILFVKSQSELELSSDQKSNLQQKQNRRALLQNLIKCRNKRANRLLKKTKTQAAQANIVHHIKQQIMQLLRQKEGEDNVWLVQSDKFKNFENYFPDHNSDRLSQRFSSKTSIFNNLTYIMEGVTLKQIVKDSNIKSLEISRKNMENADYGRRVNQRPLNSAENIDQLQQIQSQQLKNPIG